LSWLSGRLLKATAQTRCGSPWRYFIVVVREDVVPRTSQILDVELSRDILAQPDEEGAVHARVTGHDNEIVDRRIERGIVDHAGADAQNAKARVKEGGNVVVGIWLF